MVLEGQTDREGRQAPTQAGPGRAERSVEGREGTGGFPCREWRDFTLVKNGVKFEFISTTVACGPGSWKTGLFGFHL